ncbi:hypothetical protein BH10PSE17_BH10PSE17_26480 [soil metagenome]
MIDSNRRLLVLAVPALALATACSPRFNWREVRDDNNTVALLPARPQKVVRPLPLLEATIQFTLISAEVGDSLFAFGSASLPDALRTPATLPRVIDRFQEVLINQTRTTLERTDDAPTRAWTLARLPPPTASRQIEARQGGKRLVARFYVDRGVFIEQAAWFDADAVPAADLTTFLDGLTPG